MTVKVGGAVDTVLSTLEQAVYVTTLTRLFAFYFLCNCVYSLPSFMELKAVYRRFLGGSLRTTQTQTSFASSLTASGAFGPYPGSCNGMKKWCGSSPSVQSPPDSFFPLPPPPPLTLAKLIFLPRSLLQLQACPI